MKTLTLTLCLSALVAFTYATNCYVCDTLGGTCHDEYSKDGNHVIDCTSDPALYTEDGGCSKDKSKSKILGIDIYTTDRKCGQDFTNSNCMQADRINVNIFGIKSEGWECSCVGDLCNSGSQAMLSTSLLLAAIMKLVL